jgi:hypothetical protein
VTEIVQNSDQNIDPYRFLYVHITYYKLGVIDGNYIVANVIRKVCLCEADLSLHMYVCSVHMNGYVVNMCMGM